MTALLPDLHSIYPPNIFAFSSTLTESHNALLLPHLQTDIFSRLLRRSRRGVRVPGGGHGLGSLADGAAARVRVPGHLLFLGFDVGHLPHRAPLQHPGGTAVQGQVQHGRLSHQCPPPHELSQQWLRSAVQRPRGLREPNLRPRHQAQVLLCSGGGQLGDL